MIGVDGKWFTITELYRNTFIQLQAKNNLYSSVCTKVRKMKCKSINQPPVSSHKIHKHTHTHTHKCANHYHKCQQWLGRHTYVGQGSRQTVFEVCHRIESHTYVVKFHLSALDLVFRFEALVHGSVVSLYINYWNRRTHAWAHRLPSSVRLTYLATMPLLEQQTGVTSAVTGMNYFLLRQAIITHMSNLRNFRSFLSHLMAGSFLSPVRCIW